MPKDVWYEPDHDGIAEWALSSDMEESMLTMANIIVRYAIQTSPRSGDNGDHYQDHFAVAPAIVQAGFKHENRAGAIVNNSSDYAMAVERRHHVLSRAASYADGRRRYADMTPKQRESAKNRIAKGARKRRKRASST